MEISSTFEPGERDHCFTFPETCAFDTWGEGSKGDWGTELKTGKQDCSGKERAYSHWLGNISPEYSAAMFSKCSAKRKFLQGEM